MGNPQADTDRPLVTGRALRPEPALIRIAFDTNILVYAEGLGVSPADDGKIAASQALLRALASKGRRPHVAAQALAELHHVLVRKGRCDLQEAKGRIARLRSFTQVTATDDVVIGDALDIATRHRLAIFDAVILAAAARAGCVFLLSEDLQEGFRWQGVTIANPLRADPIGPLAELLR